jgi:hypothetical protein
MSRHRGGEQKLLPIIQAAEFKCCQILIAMPPDEVAKNWFKQLLWVASSRCSTRLMTPMQMRTNDGLDTENEITIMY